MGRLSRLLREQEYIEASRMMNASSIAERSSADYRRHLLIDAGNRIDELEALLKEALYAVSEIDNSHKLLHPIRTALGASDE